MIMKILCFTFTWTNVTMQIAMKKPTARGFKEEGGNQEYFTAIMLDILRIMEKMQKECQRQFIILSDIEVSKKTAIESFNLMEEKLFSGREGRNS